MCLDDMLPEDAEVRALEIIIDKMDIHSLGFTYSNTKSTGRPPYDPSDITDGKFRSIADRPHEKYARSMNKILLENADMYKQCKQLAENP